MKRPSEVVLHLSRFLGFVLVFGVLSVFPDCAQAQLERLDAATARAQYRKAHVAIDAKDWDTARRLLLDLWSRTPTYDVASSLGQVEFWLNRRASAARYFAYALRNLPPAESREMVTRLQSALEELKPQVGTVEVLVNRDEAAVTVDGEAVGLSPLPEEVYVDPGERVFEARAGNAVAARATINVVAGRSYKVELTVPDSAASSTAPVTSNPPPASEFASPPPAPRRSPKSKIPLYVAGGVTVAGLAAGIGLTFAATASGDHIADLQSEVGPNGCAGASSPVCSDLADSVERRDTQRNWSYVSFAVAGAAAVGGVVYLLWPAPRSSRLSVKGTWTADGAMLSISGPL